VWLYGGGNTIGATSGYDGSALATRQGVVVVMAAYRLGGLGWFRHASLRRDCAAGDAVCLDDNSGNFGTLDQIHALGWVRDNIAAFGGDPTNVTIFGESAGARNVLALLVSPRAAGLFQRAISQSGGTYASSLAEAEHATSDAEPGAPTSSAEIVKRLGIEPTGLRDVPATAFVRAYDSGGSPMYYAPQLFPDGAVLPAEELLTVIRAGRHNPVPVLIGTNKDEQKLFNFLSPRYVWRLFGVLPIVRDERAYFRDSDYVTRTWKIRGLDEPARALAAVQPGRVFAYRWDWDEQPSVLWADLGELIGAAHGLEIAFVFGHWSQGANSRALYTQENAPGREALSAAMQSYWAEFARNGDPGRGARGELPAWTAWDEAGDKYIVLDTEAGGGIRMSRETETLEALVDEIGADASYADAAERCVALALIHRSAPAAFSAAQFAAAAGGSCASQTPQAWLAAVRR
jgi:para-nitrobenzyl esterase